KARTAFDPHLVCVLVVRSQAGECAATVNEFLNGADIGAEAPGYLALDIPARNVPTIPEERAAEGPHHLVETAWCRLDSGRPGFVVPLLKCLHEQMCACRSRRPRLQPNLGVNLNVRKPLSHLSQMQVEPFISAFVF